MHQASPEAWFLLLEDPGWSYFLTPSRSLGRAVASGTAAPSVTSSSAQGKHHSCIHAFLWLRTFPAALGASLQSHEPCMCHGHAGVQPVFLQYPLPWSLQEPAALQALPQQLVLILQIICLGLHRGVDITLLCVSHPQSALEHPGFPEGFSLFLM